MLLDCVNTRLFGVLLNNLVSLNSHVSRESLYIFFERRLFDANSTDLGHDVIEVIYWTRIDELISVQGNPCFIGWH